MIAYTQEQYDGILTHNPNNSDKEKMSKSKGNTISVDEVVHGVATIDHPYEFRVPIIDGELYRLKLIDYKKFCVWKDSNFYFTANRYGKIPVFLCHKGREDPCQFPHKDGVIEQHEDHPFFKQHPEWFQ